MKIAIEDRKYFAIIEKEYSPIPRIPEMKFTEEWPSQNSERNYRAIKKGLLQPELNKG